MDGVDLADINFLLRNLPYPHSLWDTASLLSFAREGWCPRDTDSKGGSAFHFAVGFGFYQSCLARTRWPEPLVGPWHLAHLCRPGVQMGLGDAED